ncbi:hypothetical protein M3O53_01185, partial [Xanthomonas nasturtii]|nr:hypothetical protein [Xanthomonas nasturtii]
MRYCLVAPGTSLFIDPDATASNIGYFYEPVHDLRRSVQTMRMRQKTYPSDMSREQFAHVQPILEQARKRTK